MSIDWMRCLLPAHVRFGYRICLAVLSAVYCVLIATFAHTEGSGLYALWVCAMFLCLGGNFSLFPSCIVDLFGPEYSAQACFLKKGCHRCLA
jgi:hypothetical protein